MTLPPEWQNPEPKQSIDERFFVCVIALLISCEIVLVIALTVKAVEEIFESEPKLPDHCNAHWKEKK